MKVRCIKDQFDQHVLLEFSKRNIPLIKSGTTYTVKRSRYLTGDLGFELVEFPQLWLTQAGVLTSDKVPIIWDHKNFNFSYDSLLDLFIEELFAN